MRTVTYALIVSLFSLALVGCGSSTQQTQAFDASFDVVIEDGTKKYDPMEQTVTGDHGTISVTNQLDADHGFVIREFGIQATVPPGETMEFNVDSAEPGEYTVDCHLHAAHKEGTLIVEAP